MITLGITGKIGSGKSSACKMLVEQLTLKGVSVTVLDTDKLFKEFLKDDPYYIASMRRCCGLRKTESMTKTNLINMMNTMSIKKYVQYIHNINYHMNWVIQRRLLNCTSDIVIIESALLLDTPLAFQCDNILEIVVNKDIREKRVLERDKDIRSEKDTLKLINFQEKYLTHRYRSTLNINKDNILKQYKVTAKTNTEAVDLYLFVLGYSEFLKSKLKVM